MLRNITMSLKEETIETLLKQLYSCVVKNIKDEILAEMAVTPEPEPTLPPPVITIPEPITPEPVTPEPVTPESVTPEPEPEPEPETEPVVPECIIPEDDTVTIIYAKRQKVVQGRKKLMCIGLKWNNSSKYTRASECRSVGNEIAKFYKRNSKELLDFQVSATTVNIPLNANKKNLNKAENIAKGKHKGADIYAIFSSLNAIDGKGNSNAGKNIAHLRGSSSRTAEHEVGHCIGLGHAGAYKKGGSLDYYGDGYSVMSSMPSGTLTSPQYYKLGWFTEKEVAIYDPNSGPKTFELKKVNDFEGVGLKAVIVKTGDKRDAYISVIKAKDAKGDKLTVVLHLSSGGASQRVKMFGTKYHDDRFTGLLIKKLDQVDGTVKISIEKGSLSKSIIDDDDDCCNECGDCDDCEECACDCEGYECVCLECRCHEE